MDAASPASGTSNAFGAMAALGTTAAFGTMAEDYVKVVWKAHEWSGEGLTTNELAATLGVAPSSVSGNLKKLGRDGLLDYEPYGRATLTEAGRMLALRMVRRHRLLETWLVAQHGYSWSEVHDEAEVLEHAVSERLLESIDEQLGYPDHDPHGDPIPRADGTIVHPTGIRLDELAADARVRVVRVSDHEPALLRYLEGLSLTVGSRLTVTARHEFAGSLTVVLGDEPGGVELSLVAARAIWVAS